MVERKYNHYYLLNNVDGSVSVLLKNCSKAMEINIPYAFTA